MKKMFFPSKSADRSKENVTKVFKFLLNKILKFPPIPLAPSPPQGFSNNLLQSSTSVIQKGKDFLF